MSLTVEEIKNKLQSPGDDLVFFVNGKKERIAKAHGSQCGFCTPGIVMSMYALLRNNPQPNMHDIQEAFQGIDGGCCGGNGQTNSCCMTNGNAQEHDSDNSTLPVQKLYDQSEFMPLDPTQEIIFPPELMTLSKQPQRELRFVGERVVWIQPCSLKELLELKATYPNAKLVVGNTEVGIEMKFKNLLYPVILAPAYIPELNIIQHTQDGIQVGASVTLTVLGEVLRTAVKNLPAHQTEVFKAVLEQLRWFAGQQIRNVAGQYFSAFKQSPRKEDDIAIVTCGMNVLFKEQSNIVQSIRISYGGMASVTVFATTTCNRQWNEELLEEACTSLAEEMILSPSAPGGMVTYRRTLTISFFYKFFLTVQHKLALDLQMEGVTVEDIRPEYATATELFQLDLPSSVQLYQATGEAIYCDDIPCYENELHLALVTSTKAHALIKSIDTSDAMAVPGVVAFVSAKDIPGSNMTGPAVYDETVFADDKVTCVGHVVGAIVADTQAHAQRAAKAVKISYEELQPVIVTIQDAIANKSFFQPVRSIERGDVAQGFKDSDHILHGGMHIGGQEHFYLETNCTLAVPRGEDGEMELFVSTQSASKTQALVAKALGVPANRVVCRVKRMGGAFGGKECRSTILSTVVAVAAYMVKRPVRCMLDRDEDMLVTGGRHPFFGHYKVGYMNDGRVMALDVTLYSNAGNSLDLSLSILERALFHMDNSYNIPNIRGTGYMCKTNLPSNSAFRGFGGPQGMMIAESWMSDVALSCGLPAEEVRRMNLYKEGDFTPFNQRLDQFTIDRCWEECMQLSDFNKRKDAVEQYNRQHRWTKRGLSIIPTKFGISFTAVFLNQAGALVLVYSDGSVLLTHGGTEMGQGLHTKMIQVASKTLGIPCSKIHITETSTNTVPNTSPTAASASSDLNGMAIYVKAAYFDRVSLSANGFYKTPDLGYDFETNSGRPFNYFSYGVAVSEVEIDCLTGSHKNLHTSIVMDVGKSLNPALDIGQVEGGFMQGLGLFTLEELRYSPDGYLYTRGPGMYKIPAFGDIPIELKVSLLRDAPNEKAIYSSKAVGEPPLFLAASVFYAIKDAITAARAESGLTGPFRLDSPATPERIRNACEDKFTKLFDMMEFDRAEHDNDRIEKTNENGINTETHASGTEEDLKSCKDHKEPQKSWSLERNWGFTLEELFQLALKFFKEMNGKAFNPTYEENLRLVALHKQITIGPYDPKACPEIGFFDVLGNDRRKEWLRLGSMAKEDAMEDFVKLLNSCCSLFAPYVTSHKIEKEEQEKRRQQIMAVLNAQTAVQFQQYAKQQYPDNPEQQQLLIRQLQEQHYQQYMHQALRLQQMALQKQQDPNVTQTSEALPAPVSNDAAPTCNPNSQSNSLENQEQQTDSKSFHLCVEGKTGELPIIAPSMWTRPQIKEFKEKVLHDQESVITVGRGEVLTIRVPTHQDGSHLFWEFATDDYDIGFGLHFEWKDVTIPTSTETTETKEVMRKFMQAVTSILVKEFIF
ncbi:xanthine dehydrogenase oxidase [Labeo rohita]|uniref:xanthine dehydrogenase n=1 Tax=Labeo rohita TaxID=84645 RepID=A0A498MMT6_LABRO|nr:xanthine dehydrogenase oxidase [Labeo rohita]